MPIPDLLGLSQAYWAYYRPTGPIPGLLGLSQTYWVYPRPTGPIPFLLGLPQAESICQYLLKCVILFTVDDSMKRRPT